MRDRVVFAALAPMAVMLVAAPVHAQLAIDGRVGIAVPSIGISHLIDPGVVVGGGLAVGLSPRVSLRATIGFGSHSGAFLEDVEVPDKKIHHYIAGVGLLLTNPGAALHVAVNLGAGALAIRSDFEGADSDAFVAINTGGEFGHRLSSRLLVFASVQADVGVRDDGDFGTDAAVVWPLAVGLRATVS